MAILYKLSAAHPISHFVEIEMHVSDIDGDEVVFQLPSWRPGRYEIANFAKNIRKWKAVNKKNEALAFRKLNKDSWSVSTDGAKELIVKYEYYCAQLDAGACWVDDEQIYINPVHCFLFIHDRIHEECIVELSLPANYRIATSLQKSGERILLAEDYDELVDSPFIASSTLQVKSYEASGINFSIAIQGDTQPDWPRILADFKAFSEKQIEIMGSFPVEDYIFLVQILPNRFYHGVEHLRSTVLALGPGSQLMNESLYTDFIGVASHELFHAWNIKTIRPIEMMPYDYTKENYSRLGYVYEGVTTYYGDQILARADVYTIDQYFVEVNLRLQKHFDNPGRLNMAVADSSFDTWLDGYVPGVPGRKTSIYDEGSLTAMMTDLLIRKNTDHKASLDTVMVNLYNDFGKKMRGYTDHDYISLVSHCAGVSLADFFIDFVYGTEDDTEILQETLNYAGLLLHQIPSEEESERYFGFKISADSRITKVTAVYPDSPAFTAGLGKDDEIVAVNERKWKIICRNYFF
ncbi:MAG: M61 family metallopeptidase [Bacteroidetes bacterium]|nr:M61 family metallopeptidase [Bacteroidota bacterium]